MKDTEKPSFASLNPSLLARKGGARPAMRPQLQPLPGAHSGQPLEDLGWNDMGHAEEERHADPLPLTPAPASPEAPAAPTQSEPPASLASTQPSEVQRQQQAIENSLTEPETDKQPAAQPVAKPAPTPKAKSVRRSNRRRPNGHALEKGKRAAFTLRLDQSRHLKLRLACTMNNRSAQQIVTEALDTFLEDIPELDSLAAKVNRH